MTVGLSGGVRRELSSAVDGRVGSRVAGRSGLTQGQWVTLPAGLIGSQQVNGPTKA